MNKTYLPPVDTIERKWYVIDATDQRLGRLASEIAKHFGAKISQATLPLWMSAIL